MAKWEYAITRVENTGDWEQHLRAVLTARGVESWELVAMESGIWAGPNSVAPRTQFWVLVFKRQVGG